MKKLQLVLAVLLSGCTLITSLGDREFRDEDAGTDPPAEDAGGESDAGGLVDAGFDAGMRDAGTDACVPTEICNALDDDCDGMIDEGFDLTSDEANCGACGAVCGGAFCGAGACVRAVEVETGEGHTCALLSNGEVWCWGRSAHGQLGDGTVGTMSTRRWVPTRVPGLTDATAIAVGSFHSCAVHGARTLSCWGANGSGQVGVGRMTTAEPNPRQVALATGAVDVVAGGRFTCALDVADRVYCWGLNSSGQLGLGDTSARSEPSSTPSLTGVNDLFRSYGASMYATTSGGLYRWGGNVLTPSAFDAGGAVGSVAASNSHACASLTDGTAHCWGGNANGQLGDGSTENSLTEPVMVADLVSVDFIGVGYYSSCAIADLAVWCWGAPYNGQLGSVRTTDSPRPLRVPGVEAVDVDGGDRSYCAVTPTGAVTCWGLNGFGQLGREPASDPLPAPVIWP